MQVLAVRFDDTSQRARLRSLPLCPICRDTMVAAEASVLLDRNHVQYLWSCDACGHGFVTEGKIVCH